MYAGGKASLDVRVDGDGVPGDRRMDYFQQICAYTAHFDPDQLNICLFEEFKRDNQGCMAAIWSFLGLPPVNIPLREEKDGYALTLEDDYFEQGRARLRTDVKRLARLLRDGGYRRDDISEAWGY